jgi:hypothetical protein
LQLVKITRVVSESVTSLCPQPGNRWSLVTGPRDNPTAGLLLKINTLGWG